MLNLYLCCPEYPEDFEVNLDFFVIAANPRDAAEMWREHEFVDGFAGEGKVRCRVRLIRVNVGTRRGILLWERFPTEVV